MERDQNKGWEIVGAAIVVLILAAITVNSTVGWSADGAAWVQAIGSVLALFVTGGVVVYQSQNRVRQEGRATAERLSARIAVVELVAKNLASYIQFQKNLADGATQGDWVGAPIRLKYALQEGKLIQLSEMPSRECVQAMIHVRALVDLLSVLFNDGGEDPLKPDQIEVLTTAHWDMLRNLASLVKEAQRLSN